MSRFPSFLEYLNDKGKVVEKPEVEQVPDYHGPDDKTPPGSKVPYKTTLTPKSQQKGEKGFAELGDGKLVYDPDTSIKYDTKKDVMKESKENGTGLAGKARVDAKADYKGPFSSSPKGGKPYVSNSQKAGEKGLGDLGSQETKYEPNTDTCKKTKTEAFLNKTRSMSLGEFTKYMLKECGCGQVSGDDLPYVTAYSTGKIQPHPPEAIRYVSTLANKNDGILENLVSTIIGMGYLNKLMKAILEHPQAYEELTSLLGDDEAGAGRCKSLAGAMNSSYTKFLSDQEGLYESVSSPIGFEDEEDLGDEEESDEEDHEDDLDSDHDHHDDDDLEDEDDMDHEDMDGDDEELGPDREDLEGDDDLGDEEESDEEYEEEEELGMHGSEEERPREKRLKKKFAHHHLLDAMKGHEHMMKAMRGV